MLDQILTFFVNLLYIGFLLGEGFLSKLLEILLMLCIDIKSVRQWCPFGLVDEFGDGAATFLFICHNSVVNIDVVKSERTLLGQRLHIYVVSDNLTVGFEALWSGVRCGKVVLTFESLVAFNRILEIKLDLRVIGREVETHFVYKF